MDFATGRRTNWPLHLGEHPKLQFGRAAPFASWAAGVLARPTLSCLVCVKVDWPPSASGILARRAGARPLTFIITLASALGLQFELRSDLIDSESPARGLVGASAQKLD